MSASSRSFSKHSETRVTIAQVGNTAVLHPKAHLPKGTFMEEQYCSDAGDHKEYKT